MDRQSRRRYAGTRRWLWRALICAALASLHPPAFAQESRGSIAGRVSDSGGAVLPGVTVTIVNVDTNGTTVIVTNDSGLYTALYLTPGTYSVTAELSGFRRAINPKIPVRVGD
jgi:hypothetical protein